jgi:activator of HSP90 ATPase
MTGGAAKVSARVGGKFSAWDGYITGKNILLEENKKIVQEWRTTEFPESASSSIVEILLTEKKSGTTLTLKHHKIPYGQPDYKAGWTKHYFEPMKKYFAGLKSKAPAK